MNLSLLQSSIKYSQKADHKINFQPFPKKKYQIIYADPPWHYGGKLQHEGKKGDYTGGCKNFYPCIPTKNLAEMEIQNICHDDCLLFMWATNPHLEQAIMLGKMWGFNYSTVAFIWDKQMHNPGRYTLSQCEIVLLFKKGKIPAPQGRRNVRQFFSEKRRKHSMKPDEIRKFIHEMFPKQKKIEIFARQKKTGWDSWGIEIE